MRMRSKARGSSPRWPERLLATGCENSLRLRRSAAPISCSTPSCMRWRELQDQKASSAMPATVSSAATTISAAGSAGRKIRSTAHTHRASASASAAALRVVACSLEWCGICFRSRQYPRLRGSIESCPMDAPIANATPASVTLSGLELTGRARTHVRELAELGCPLHPLAATALQAMRAAAAGAGIDLVPVSGFRDFERQLAIWNGKFSGARPLLDRADRPLAAEALSEAERVAAILVWSALPGASRHHWGSDCDLIDRTALPTGAAVELFAQHYAADGRYARLSAWLARHAHEFGFFLPYDVDRGGGQPEPWHWSYAPLAAVAQAALHPDLLRAAVAARRRTGASGAADRGPRRSGPARHWHWRAAGPCRRAQTPDTGDRGISRGNSDPPSA